MSDLYFLNNDHGNGNGELNSVGNGEGCACGYGSKDGNGFGCYDLFDENNNGEGLGCGGASGTGDTRFLRDISKGHSGYGCCKTDLSTYASNNASVNCNGYGYGPGGSGDFKSER